MTLIYYSTRNLRHFHHRLELPNGITELRDSVLISVASTLVKPIKEVEDTIKLFKSTHTAPRNPLELIFMPTLKITTHSQDDVSQIHVD